MTARPELLCGRWEKDCLVLPVRVRARARRLELGAPRAGRLQLSLTAPPLDGRANAQAQELLADHFGVSASRVSLVQGASGRDKLFRIDNPSRLPPQLLQN